jgi:GTP-binding protein EngB required for normal cell division
MILGQTGTGKSSLINYLAGKEVVKTGIGRPVTRKGQWDKVAFASPNNPEKEITIIDSWGLEANKAEEWKKEILGKLSESISYEEMILGTIYCISYSNARIQEFELDLIKVMLDTGYKIIIAFTNSDDSAYQEKKIKYREIFNTHFSTYTGQYSMIDVCAFSVPKIGQPKPKGTFGREELLNVLESDARSNFIKVYRSHLNSWKEESQNTLKIWYTQSFKKAHEFEGRFHDTNTTIAKKINDEINIAFKKSCDKISTKFVNYMRDAQGYYDMFSGTFSKTKLTGLRKFKDVTFSATIVGELFNKYVVKEDLKKGLKDAICRTKNEATEKINLSYSEALKIIA